MEIAIIGSLLLGGGAYLKWKPTRADLWNAIAAWAAANRDAALVRESRRKEYLLARYDSGT
jgi:hypothetical protein